MPIFKLVFLHVLVYLAILMYIVIILVNFLLLIVYYVWCQLIMLAYCTIVYHWAQARYCPLTIVKIASLFGQIWLFIGVKHYKSSPLNKFQFAKLETSEILLSGH